MSGPRPRPHRRPGRAAGATSRCGATCAAASMGAKLQRAAAEEHLRPALAGPRRRGDRRNGRIALFAAHLPAVDGLPAAAGVGTRHSAALGLAGAHRRALSRRVRGARAHLGREGRHAHHAARRQRAGARPPPSSPRASARKGSFRRTVRQLLFANWFARLAIARDRARHVGCSSCRAAVRRSRC